MPSATDQLAVGSAAELSLDFAWLNKLIAKQLLSPDGAARLLTSERLNNWHYTASLTGLTLLPRPPHQCALELRFGQVEAIPDIPNQGVVFTQSAILTVVVGFATQQFADGRLASLTFDYRLRPEGWLRAGAGDDSLWAEYPSLAVEATLALLPVLQALCYDRLRFNLARFNDYASTAPDPTGLWGARLAGVRVVGGEAPRLGLLYHATTGPGDWWPSPDLIPLRTPATARLFVSHEHVLRTVILPAFRHMYKWGTMDPHSDTDDGFSFLFDLQPVLSPLDSAPTAGGKFEAKNLVPLQPRINDDREVHFVHQINAGDLVVRIDTQVHVSVCYTLFPKQKGGIPIVPKIWQRYVYNMVPTSTTDAPSGVNRQSPPLELILESHDLDIWVNTTNAAEAWAHWQKELIELVRQFEELRSWTKAAAYVGQQLGDLFMRFLSGDSAVADIPDFKLPVDETRVDLTLYESDQQHGYSPTQLHPPISPDMPIAHRHSFPVEISVPKGQSQSLTPHHIYQLATRFQAPVAQMTAGYGLQFYQQIWRELAKQCLFDSYKVAFANHLAFHFGFVGVIWKTRVLFDAILNCKNATLNTINAMLAVDLYAKDIRGFSTKQLDTANGFREALTLALGPVFNPYTAIIKAPVVLPEGIMIELELPLPAADLPMIPTGARPDFRITTGSHPSPQARIDARHTDMRSRSKLQAKLAAMTAAAQTLPPHT